MSRENDFIPYKRIINIRTISNNIPSSKLRIDVVALDNSEIKFRVETHKDFYFDLNLESAIKLRDTLNEFIADRDK